MDSKVPLLSPFNYADWKPKMSAYLKRQCLFDVSIGAYDELMTFDTSFMHHNNPMKPEVKPYQQKLRKMHPSLEPSVKKELDKLLSTRIIFPVRHTQWIANLVPVWKKNGEIKICVDFRNLNRASEKYSYSIPPMEQIL